MFRRIPLIFIALAALHTSPAHAWDSAKAGRYGGLDLDTLDVGGQIKARSGLIVGGSSSIGGVVSFTNDKMAIPFYVDTSAENLIVMTPGGARHSIASLGGHDNMGKWGEDSFRSQASFRATSAADAGIEETTMLIEHRGVTGYSPPWYPNYNYPAGTQITGGNGFIFETLSACKTSNTRPTASSPWDPHPPQTDGTCTWRYVGIGAGNNKTPLIIYGSIEPPDPSKGRAGGGQGWAQAMIMNVMTGAWPQGGGFAVGQEIDTGNGRGECPPGVPNGCQIYGSFINGNGLYKSTIGTFYGGDKGFHVGILLSPTAASSIGISNSSMAETGYYDNGTHTIASFLDRSTSGYAIKLEGTYASGQIAGAGWGVNAGGGLSASSISTPNGVFAGVFSSSDSAPLQLATSKGIGFTVQASASATANYLSTLPAGAGSGPILSALGADANITLNLSGRGTGPVQVLGNLNATGAIGGATSLQANNLIGTGFRPICANAGGQIVPCN